MKIIKLNAIDSTNTFLKELAQNSVLENYTVVCANKQTKGRGQQESKWVSEPFKNLTASVFITNFDLKIECQKFLNFAVSLSIFKVLKSKNVQNLSIKWPNDILAGNKKICGILIENTFKGNYIKNSIIGFGINVNQENFSNSIKNATSLKKLTNTTFDLEVILSEIIESIKKNITLLTLKNYILLENDYLNVLYKKNIPTMFKDKSDVLFMGKILGISSNGNLQIELENESIEEFGIKEVSFA